MLRHSQDAVLQLETFAPDGVIREGWILTEHFGLESPDLFAVAVVDYESVSCDVCHVHLAQEIKILQNYERWKNAQSVDIMPYFLNNYRDTRENI